MRGTSSSSSMRRCLQRRPYSITTYANPVYSVCPSSSPHRASVITPCASVATQRAFASLSTKHIGAHISASGGCLKALDNAQQLLGPHARAFAFFIRPRLSWKPVAPIAPADATEFRQRLRRPDSQFDPAHIVVHGSYILNFGSHDAQLRRKSVDLMVEEVTKCMQLGVPSYVFHPGSCTRVPDHLEWTTLLKKTSKKTPVTEAQRDEAVARESQARALSIAYIGECMAEVLEHTQDVTLCVENMCGQGNVLGRSFDELREILDSAVAHSPNDTVRSRVGVCLDTCHAHASGLAMHTAEECEEMMASFDTIMGTDWLQHDVLKVLHVNDSMDPCGARRDRHENIGLGRIGLSAFEWIMNSPRFDTLPMILETPRRGDEALQERLSMVENDAHRELLRANMEADSDANEIDLLHELIRP